MKANSEARLRYPDSVEPVSTDGRDVDTAIATLEGEAAQQQVTREDEHLKEIAPSPWNRMPEVAGTDTTYYDRPVLKQPVWSIDIPIYYFLGGAAGAALTLGAAMQAAAPDRSHELRKLSAICHWIGIVGSTAGAGFLVHDLGRPMRFLHMVRVFRPTSPMNIGSWILAGAAPSAITTGLLLNRGGLPGVVGEISGYISGVFGAALSGYTGVLVSNTAIPIWQESRRWLPVLFTASGAFAAASITEFFHDSDCGRRVTLTFGTVAGLAELGASLGVERAVARTPRVGEPLRHGRGALLWNAASAMTAASLTLSLFPGKSRTKRVAAGLLGAAGSLCMRFAIHYLGEQSARDPRAAFAQRHTAR